MSLKKRLCSALTVRRRQYARTLVTGNNVNNERMHMLKLKNLPNVVHNNVLLRSRLFRYSDVQFDILEILNVLSIFESFGYATKLLTNTKGTKGAAGRMFDGNGSECAAVHVSDLVQVVFVDMKDAIKIADYLQCLDLTNLLEYKGTYTGALYSDPRIRFEILTPGLVSARMFMYPALMIVEDVQRIISEQSKKHHAKSNAFQARISEVRNVDTSTYLRVMKEWKDYSSNMLCLEDIERITTNYGELNGSTIQRQEEEPVITA